jgi:hypothetical protein
MIIRVAQAKVLADDLSKRELMRYARDRFPAYFKSRSSEELGTFCDGVRELARRLGITANSDLATVLDLTIMYGAQFHEARWASDVFSVRDWSGAEKIRVIRSRVRAQIPNF